METNKYEYRFKIALNNVQSAILNNEDNIKGYMDSVVAIDKAIESLEQSLEIIVGNSAAVPVINKAIEDYKSEKLKKKAAIFSCAEHKKRLETELAMLRRICPHIRTEYVGTDYHKNEDSHRCLMCGAIV